MWMVLVQKASDKRIGYKIDLAERRRFSKLTEAISLLLLSTTRTPLKSSAVQKNNNRGHIK